MFHQKYVNLYQKIRRLISDYRIIHTDHRQNGESQTSPRQRLTNI